MGSNPTRPATTPFAIISYLLHLQKDGFKPQTIQSHGKILRFLSKNTQLDDPETVRLFVASRHVSYGRKEKIVDAYSSYCRFNQISFSQPRYTREDPTPFIPLQAEIEDLIKASRTIRHQAYLRLLNETGMRCGEASRLQFRDYDFVKQSVRIVPEKYATSGQQVNPEYEQVHPFKRLERQRILHL